MLISTRGIVLKSVKYGETSIIVSIYTLRFGMQSYIVNGVRTTQKKGNKANIYQVSTILELIVYHHPNKKLQRIREAKAIWNIQSAQYDVAQYTVAIFMIEVLSKAIPEPEQNEYLYQFIEESITQIPTKKLANQAILFLIYFSQILGYEIRNNYSETQPYFFIQEGSFVETPTAETCSLNDSILIHQMLEDNAEERTLSNQARKEVLSILIQYLKYHIPHLTELKSITVLHELLR
ncbi:MAG: DNA repair protein RecO [Chitinophagaceae bacterium]|nr:DNA repair protein RecO [Chitinophagaceae bacterium]HMN33322.1 DNA repair protein RecO [Chitinophagaceae bacterium]